MMSSGRFVLPGEVITSEAGYLRGHGSYLRYETGGEQHQQSGSDEGEGRGGGPAGAVLVASVAGQVERVNKLISVRATKTRYMGEVGDLVVARVTAVDSKRWRADVNGTKDAVLQLASVNLPGGVQRMRTYEDQLQMRSLFKENDLFSAEVQSVGSSSGGISLHTRSLKYGKLENGQLVEVPSSLIKRLPQHYISLPCGVDMILGRNGFIWLQRSIPKEWRLMAGDATSLEGPRSVDEAGQDEHLLSPLAETLQRIRTRHASTPLLPDERRKISALKNIIELMKLLEIQVCGDSVWSLYQRAETMGLTDAPKVNYSCETDDIPLLPM